MNRPLSLNRWNYVEGNPVNRLDPSGQCWYQSASDFMIYHNYLEQPLNAPCTWFIDIASQIGISLPPDAHPQDVFSGNIVPASFGPMPVSTSYSLPDDYWQVIKFTFDLGWETRQVMTFGGSLHPTIPTPLGPVFAGGDFDCNEFGEGCGLTIYGGYGVSDLLCGGLGINIGFPLSLSAGLYHQIGETSTYSTIGQITTSVPVVPLSGLPTIASGGQSVQSVRTHLGQEDVYILTTKSILEQYGGSYVGNKVKPTRSSKIIKWKVLDVNRNREILLEMYDGFNLQEVVP